MKLLFWIGVAVLAIALINEKILPILIGLYFLYSFIHLAVPKYRLLFSVMFSVCVGVFMSLLFLIDYIRPLFLYKTKVIGGVGYAQYFGYPIHFDDFYFLLLLSIFLAGTLIFMMFTKRKK